MSHHAKLLLVSAVILLNRPAPITGAEPVGAGRIQFRTNDVVSFLGGADVVGQQESGHLEAVLTIALHKFHPRFRNFGWEGATVFDQQPRDFGFPSLKARLQKAGVSLILVQYGRSEAMNPKNASKDFKAHYEKLIDECLQLIPQVVLVTPAPFENGGGLLPDLSARNIELSAYAKIIRELAQSRHLTAIDLYNELSLVRMRLTENGLDLTPRGHAIAARAFARQLDIGNVAESAGETDAKGRWSNPQFEGIRQEILRKNRLWFNYWRPQNWAFLGGDRITQPSSRDHRNPAVRWFPDEMERFLPLIQESEIRINQSAASIAQ